MTKTMPDLSRPYLMLYSGQLVSLVGSSIAQFVLIWYITVVTNSGLYLALAALLGVGSSILTGLFAGVIADRYNRKLIIAVTDFLQALATVVLMYLFWMGIAEISHIMGLLLVRGLVGGLQRPAVQAIIPSMVPREKLSRISALTSFSNSLISISTPVIAAILLGVFGIGNMVPLLAIDAVTFVLALIPLALVKVPNEHLKIKEEKARNGELEQTSFAEEFKEGFRVIKEGPGLLALLVSFAMTNFFLAGLMNFLPLVISSPQGLGADEFVLAMSFSAFQGGSLVMTVILMKYKITTGLVKKVTVGILTAFAGMIIGGTGVVLGNFYLLWTGFVFVGFALPFAAISSSVIWQTYFSAEYQGRIYTVRGTIAQIISPVSLITVGVLTEFLPQSLKYLILGSGLMGFVMYISVYSLTRIKDIDNHLEGGTKRPKKKILVAVPA